MEAVSLNLGIQMAADTPEQDILRWQRQNLIAL